MFGVSRNGPIDPWIPLMLFTILFGLSMDYEVFLLSRIREEWLRTGDNATAVADGLAQTGRVITAAAAIMFCVFGSFVIGDLRVLKVFGLGLAAAVLVDATIVRMVLVPATMELLGGANWWFPRWLDRIVPVLDVEGDPDDRPVPPAADSIPASPPAARSTCERSQGACDRRANDGVRLRARQGESAHEMTPGWRSARREPATGEPNGRGAAASPPGRVSSRDDTRMAKRSQGACDRRANQNGRLPVAALVVPWSL